MQPINFKQIQTASAILLIGGLLSLTTMVVHYNNIDLTVAANAEPIVTTTINNAATTVNKTAAKPMAQLAQTAGEPALLLLNADALVTTINGGVVNLTALVRDAVGKPVSSATVTLQSAHGTLAPATLVTDANGTALASFTAGPSSGQARITATVNGGGNDLTREVVIQLRKPNSDTTTHALEVNASQQKIALGQQMNVSAVLRDSGGAPVVGELVSLFGALGEVTPASAVTDASGRVNFTYRAGAVNGQAMVTALAEYAAHSAAFQVGEVTVPEQPTLNNHIYLPVVSR